MQSGRIDNPSVGVVGGGIIGLSIAWRLAQAGARVLVFDSGAVGREASWAGAGMLAPGGECEERTPFADLAIASRAIYQSFLEELESASGMTIEFQLCGAYQLALEAAEFKELEARTALQRAAGIRSERTQWRGREAWCYPDDATVDPRQVIAALARACENNRVSLREGEAVRRIYPQRIDTDGGTWPVDAVVLAAGAWSTMIPIDGFDTSVELPRAFPVRGHLLRYRPGGERLEGIIRHGRTYLLQRAPGGIVAGATTEHVGFDRALNMDAVHRVKQRAETLLPTLRGNFALAWNGFRPGCAEGPQVRRLGETPIWLAYGHYRNGILLAPVTAQSVTGEICSALSLSKV